MADTYKSCSFCGKAEHTVQSMFSAGSVNICDECVCYCYEMLYGPGIAKSHRKAAKAVKNTDISQLKLMKPAEIKGLRARAEAFSERRRKNNRRE